MVPKTGCCSDVLSFIEKFLRGKVEVVISLLLIVHESLGISIMFIVLFLSGGE